MCTSSPTSVPGRSLANGPQSERSPTLASSIYTCGPMRHSAPIWVAPLRTVNGSITVSWPTVTVASTNVLSGSTMVTPPSIRRSSNLRRTMSVALASRTRSLIPIASLGSSSLTIVTGVDDLEDARRGQERGVSVDHQHVAAAQLAGWNLLQRVRRTPGVALVDQLDAAVEVGRHVGVVGVRDHRNVLRAGLVDGFEDPVDHGTATNGMEDFGNPRPHARAVAGGEDDRSQGWAQLAPIIQYMLTPA